MYSLVKVNYINIVRACLTFHCVLLEFYFFPVFLNVLWI